MLLHLTGIQCHFVDSLFSGFLSSVAFNQYNFNLPEDLQFGTLLSSFNSASVEVNVGQKERKNSETNSL